MDKSRYGQEPTARCTTPKKVRQPPIPTLPAPNQNQSNSEYCETSSGSLRSRTGEEAVNATNDIKQGGITEDSEKEATRLNIPNPHSTTTITDHTFCTTLYDHPMEPVHLAVISGILKNPRPSIHI